MRASISSAPALGAAAAPRCGARAGVAAPSRVASVQARFARSPTALGVSASCSDVAFPRSPLDVHPRGGHPAPPPLFAGVAARGASAREVRAEAFFSRLFRVIRSYANALVSSVEDPEKVLEQAVMDMERDLVRLRQTAAEVTASQRRLEAKTRSASDEAEGWKRRAELALRAGDEGLAREALGRKKTAAERHGLLEAQLAAQARAADTVVGHARVLESRLAEARAKRDTLKVRAKGARSAAAVQDLVAGLDSSSALAAFERMEDKVLAMEAAAEGAAALGPAGDTLEGRFRSLEAGNSMDDELDQLRREMEERELPEPIEVQAEQGRYDNVFRRK